MIKESISIDEVIEFLNELIKTDPDTMYKLVENRISCNNDMLNHPTVQVQDYDSNPKVGFLGIINGLFGTDEKGWGPFAAVFDVICPKCGSQDGLCDEPCPKCGQDLVLGHLIEFKRTKKVNI